METKYFNPKTVNPAIVPEKKIQPKLEVNPPNDKYEKEADNVANKVSRMPNNASENLQMSPKEDEENKIQMKPSDEDESISMKPEDEDSIQMSPSSSEGQNVPQVSSELNSQLNSTKGQGNPLPENVSKEMGRNIGGDFSNVRVHTDSNAIQMNKELGAKAFTHGNDIYFNSGNYNTDSTSGKHLLAHELTHVAQQNPVSTSKLNSIRCKKDDTPSSEVIKFPPELVQVEKPEKTREKILAREAEINATINSWTEDSISPIRININDAVESFRCWYGDRGRKVNKWGIMIDVGNSVLRYIGTVAPDPRVKAAVAIIRGIVTVAKDQLVRHTDPNTDPDKIIRDFTQIMTSISSQLGEKFLNFGQTLKAKDYNTWNDIALALVGYDHPLVDIAQDTLHNKAGLPLASDLKSSEILAEMIFTYLEWERMDDLKSSTFFIDKESAEYAFATDYWRERKRIEAKKEAEKRIGKAELGDDPLKDETTKALKKASQ